MTVMAGRTRRHDKPLFITRSSSSRASFDAVPRRLQGEICPRMNSYLLYMSLQSTSPISFKHARFNSEDFCRSKSPGRKTRNIMGLIRG